MSDRPYIILSTPSPESVYERLMRDHPYIYHLLPWNQPMKEPPRNRLPAMRPALVRRIEVEGKEFYITVSFYDEGDLLVRPAEVFITIANMQAKAVNAAVQSWAVMISMALQYAIPWEKIYAKYQHADPLSAGIVNAIQACVRERASIIGFPESNDRPGDD